MIVCASPRFFPEISRWADGLAGRLSLEITKLEMYSRSASQKGSYLTINSAERVSCSKPRSALLEKSS
jgi:hypothetical protein